MAGPVCFAGYYAPTCIARCPLHQATVRQAASMLAEILASPPTLLRAMRKGGRLLLPCLRGKGEAGNSRRMCRASRTASKCSGKRALQGWDGAMAAKAGGDDSYGSKKTCMAASQSQCGFQTMPHHEAIPQKGTRLGEACGEVHKAEKLYKSMSSPTGSSRDFVHLFSYNH